MRSKEETRLRAKYGLKWVKFYSRPMFSNLTREEVKTLFRPIEVKELRRRVQNEIRVQELHPPIRP